MSKEQDEVADCNRHILDSVQDAISSNAWNQSSTPILLEFIGEGRQNCTLVEPGLTPLMYAALHGDF